MASAAIRKSQAAPSDRRTASTSLGNTWGATIRTTICQVFASSVCALTICSLGSSRTRCSRSRMMNGAVPKTISTTLASSPRPNVMNSIGKTAMGGIIETTRTSGDHVAENHGISPFSIPNVNPASALTPMPMNNRWRLAAVSAHKRISPVRTLGSKAMRRIASANDSMLGSSLSFGLASSLRSEKTR